MMPRDTRMIRFIIVLVMLEGVTLTSVDWQWSPWSRRGACSVTCGEGETRSTRVCEPSSRRNRTNPINPAERGKCEGPAEEISPCYNLPCQGRDKKPKEKNCNCGCVLQSRRGVFKSRLSYSNSVVCDWTVRATRPGNTVHLIINKFKLKSGSLKILYGPDKNKQNKQVIRMFGVEPHQKIPFTVKSSRNSINVTLKYWNTGIILDGFIELEAEFKEVGDLPPIAPPCVKPPCPDNNGNGGGALEPSVTPPVKLTIAAIAGIAACGGIIFIISIFLVYRRCRTPKHELKKSVDGGCDGDYDDAESSGSSSRSKQRSSSQEREFSERRPNCPVQSGMQGAQPSVLAFERLTDQSDRPSEQSFETEHKKRLLSHVGSNASGNHPQQQRGFPDGQFAPSTVSDWPNERRKSGELPLNAGDVPMDYRGVPVSSYGVNNNPILTPQMNMHIPHPQLGYMIRQAQLSFPTQLPPNMYQQEGLPNMYQQFQQQGIPMDAASNRTYEDQL